MTLGAVGVCWFFTGEPKSYTCAGPTAACQGCDGTLNPTSLLISQCGSCTAASATAAVPGIPMPLASHSCASLLLPQPHPSPNTAMSFSLCRSPAGNALAAHDVLVHAACCSRLPACTAVVCAGRCCWRLSAAAVAMFTPCTCCPCRCGYWLLNGCRLTCSRTSCSSSASSISAKKRPGHLHQTSCRICMLTWLWCDLNVALTARVAHTGAFCPSWAAREMFN